jgi:predicted metal-dependent peptidase
MEPKLDWRELLRDYVSSVCVGKGTSTWARPNRRYLSMDLYLPSQISEAIGGIAIVVDTSGSVNAELLTKFMAEIIGIAENTQPEALHLICCDGDVASHDIYMQDNYHALAAVREFKGGGGTDMRKALDYIEEHKLNVEVVVILTDGYTPYPDRLSKPVLWAMTEKHMTAPIGSTIHLN